MTDDPAHDRITAILAAITEIVTNQPSLPGVDVADLRTALLDGGRALYGHRQLRICNRSKAHRAERCSAIRMIMQPWRRR